MLQVEVVCNICVGPSTGKQSAERQPYINCISMNLYACSKFAPFLHIATYVTRSSESIEGSEEVFCRCRDVLFIVLILLVQAAFEKCFLKQYCVTHEDFINRSECSFFV